MEPKIEKIEEIVIAVKNADEAASYFKDLFGLNFEYEWEIEREKIRVKSVLIGGTQFQFIEPTDSESVVYKFLQTKGEGLNHLAFRVSNLDEMVKKLKKKGVKLVPNDIIEVNANGMPTSGSKVRFIFIHPKSAYGTLIELIEII